MTSLLRFIGVAALLLLSAWSDAAAQRAPSHTPLVPVVDGTLDDPAWQRALTVAEFSAGGSGSPDERTGHTVVSVLFDETAVYIGARMGPPQGVDDEGGTNNRGADWLIARFDGDERSDRALVFGVNRQGMPRSLVVAGSAVLDGDDETWEVSTGASVDGWTAEFRIPHTRLLLDGSTGEQLVGMSFERRMGAVKDLKIGPAREGASVASRLRGTLSE
jgi:hypothetical protein